MTKMTDKELNELRDRLADDHRWSLDCTCNDDESECWFHWPDIAKAEYSFKLGFDAAIKALKDNFMEKAKVDKLLNALKKIYSYFDCLHCELNANGEVCAHHLIDRQKTARQAVAEFEGEK